MRLRLNPLDVYNKEFKKTFRVLAYHPEEVDDFIEQIASDYEEVYKEAGRLKEENARLRKELAKFQEQEEQLRASLFSAQDAYKLKKEEGEKEKEIILQEARQQADKIIQEGMKKVKERENQLTQLKEMEELFRVRFRSLLESHLKYLDQLEEDSIDEDGDEENTPK